jgi:hypothetical protein
MNDYKDIYVCGEFVKRLPDNQKYIVVSNLAYYDNIRSIDENYVIYEKVKDTYFEYLEINSDVTISGELLIN